MAYYQIRKTIHDLLITKFTAMKHVNGTDSVFASVKKVFIALPESLPVCEIVPTRPFVEVAGMDFNEKKLGFVAITYEQVNTSEDQTEAERKISRLEDVEDIVIQYLEKIPDELRGNVPGVDVIRIDIGSSSWDYQNSENGLRIFLSINFDIVVLDEPKTI